MITACSVVQFIAVSCNVLQRVALCVLPELFWVRMLFVRVFLSYVYSTIRARISAIRARISAIRARISAIRALFVRVFLSYVYST